MQKKRFNILLGSLSFVAILLLNVVSVKAETYYSNNDTGYFVVIDDEAGLFTDEQKEQLADEMAQVTVYGSAAVVTTNSNALSSEDYAENCFRNYFGTNSGTVFLIDMDNRNIWFFSDGAVYRTLNQAYAETITDNVYKFASNGEYYKCAYQAFVQVIEILEGGRIAQPMKYISNVLLALIVAFMLSFYFVYNFAKKNAATKSALLSAIKHKTDYQMVEITETGVTKEYSPRSSGSGGGHGGGGHSGGGGGHGF